MQTLPSGIKKIEASDNATIVNFNVNADLLDAKIAELSALGTEVDGIGADLTAHKGSGGTAHALATTGSAGFQSAADKTKLDTIATGANNYTHPSTHPPSIIVQDAGNRFVTDAERTTWNAKASTAVASAAVNGLMSATDKTKLDGIMAGAAYVAGTYTGDNTALRDIALPFTPSAVLVILSTLFGRVEYCGFAIAGSPAYNGAPTYGPIVQTATNGFKVAYRDVGSVNSLYTNTAGAVYHYIAFR
ncbi:hypothetical protein BBD42_15675 [Paenibacillus sp. BIHB 4019]|uniref:Tail fiber protein n=1 Tax=Paenibacillus sp. BIHB 4019 TaxID=1870819 RepID=A0A1B2DJ45_9BACL|nr:hypothetical protein [Paenibacillus sp. BIHB 4019]ANY67744.1 hypothetical protein BBD42_15675 [Paenibacillus sp. BIHB 4019]